MAAGDIFRKYGEQFRKTHRLHKTTYDIEHCRFVEFGNHWEICSYGHLKRGYNPSTPAGTASIPVAIISRCNL